MYEFRYKMDATKVDRALRQYGQSFTSGDPIVRKGWQVVARVYLSQQQQWFRKMSDPRKRVRHPGDKSRWPKISPVTAALRRRGSTTTKIKSEQQLAKKAGALRPLHDTGLLFKSLSDRHSQGIAVTKVMQVTVGTNVKYAKKHDKGGTSSPPSVSSSLKRLDANIAKVTKPGKPKAKAGSTLSADGKKILVHIPGVGSRFVRRATKFHNPLYYKIRAFIKKAKRIKVPKRKIMHQPTVDEGKLLEKAWGQTVLVPLAKRFNRTANGGSG